jgi:hypothetical protein
MQRLSGRQDTAVTMKLNKTVNAWTTPQFDAVLKQELVQQAGQLPLQQGLSASSSVADTPITVVVHSAVDQGSAIRVRAGIFYEGLVGGCSCAGDPTIDSENTEYCEVQLDIDKATAITIVTLIPE